MPGPDVSKEEWQDGMEEWQDVMCADVICAGCAPTGCAPTSGTSSCVQARPHVPPLREPEGRHAPHGGIGSLEGGMLPIGTAEATSKGTVRKGEERGYVCKRIQEDMFARGHALKRGCVQEDS